jgi:hypothetical protein
MKNTYEVERLRFILNRDGMVGAVDFAGRAFRAYRNTLRNRRSKLTTELRRSYIDSCLSFREFLRAPERL